MGPIPIPEPITMAKRIQSSTQTTDMRMVKEEGGGDYQNKRGMDAKQVTRLLPRSFARGKCISS